MDRIALRLVAIGSCCLLTELLKFLRIARSIIKLLSQFMLRLIHTFTNYMGLISE